jgi:hypothetical protein
VSVQEADEVPRGHAATESDGLAIGRQGLVVQLAHVDADAVWGAASSVDVVTAASDAQGYGWIGGSGGAHNYLDLFDGFGSADGEWLVRDEFVV